MENMKYWAGPGPVEFGDEGVYRCVAHSDFGEELVSDDLTVKSKYTHAHYYSSYNITTFLFIVRYTSITNLCANITPYTWIHLR